MIRDPMMEKAKSLKELASSTARLVLFLSLFGAVISTAQKPSDLPAGWWPDPSTGLMWAAAAGNGHANTMTWDESVSYCSALQLDGYSGWRLPKVEDIATATYLYPVPIYDKEGNVEKTYDYLAFKGQLTASADIRIWTANAAQNGEYTTIFVGAPDILGIMAHPKEWGSLFQMNALKWHLRSAKPSDRNGAVCVRPIEPDLLAIAKAAQVPHPVADQQALTNYIPLNKARLAYQSGNYQECLTQAQLARAQNVDPATVDWAIGIAYGQLGDWDQAISNLEAALKINKQYQDAGDALGWAKASQKAAPKGKHVKQQPPEWK